MPASTAGEAAGEEALPDVYEDLAGEHWERARSQLISLLGVDAVPELIKLGERLKKRNLRKSRLNRPLLGREYLTKILK